MSGGGELIASYLGELLATCLMFIGLASAGGRARLYLVGIPAFWGAGAWLNWAVQTGEVSLFTGIVAAAVVVVCGALVNIPVARVPEDTVILLGLIALEAVRRAMEAVLGPQGRSGLGQPSLGTLGPEWTVVVLAGCCVAVSLLAKVMTGAGEWRRRWSALAAGEPSLVQAGGLNPRHLQALAAATACLNALVGGVLWSLLQGSASPANLGTDRAVTMFALVFVGGLSTAGGLLGAVFFVVVPILLRQVRAADSETTSVLVRNLLFGVLLIVVVRFAASGLLGRKFRFDAEAQFARL